MFQLQWKSGCKYKSDFGYFLLKNVKTNDRFMLFTCKFHNKILIWGQSDDLGFWPFSMALKATVPKILCYDLLDFFSAKSLLYMCRQSHKIPRLIRETLCFSLHPNGSWNHWDSSIDHFIVLSNLLYFAYLS